MPVLLAAIAVLGVSASGPLMAATTAPALAIAFWRNAGAALLIAPFAATHGRDEIRRLSRHDWQRCLLAGAMLAAHFAAWVSALKLTSVAAATALVGTQLLWVVLMDRLAGVTVGRVVMLGMTMSLGGVLLISGFDFAASGEAIAGDLLAIAGGLFAAFYLVVGNGLRRTMSTTTYTFTCYGTCALLLVGATFAFDVPVVGFSARAWLLIAAVTVSAQLVGHSLLNHLLASMSPTVISLIVLLEVPGAAVLAGVFLGQTPPWGVYAGLGLMLAGLAVVAARRQPAPAAAAVAG